MSAAAAKRPKVSRSRVPAGRQPSTRSSCTLSPGRRLSQWFADAGVSLDELAVFVGCSRELIGRICRGEVSPAPELAERIAIACENTVPGSAWDTWADGPVQELVHIAGQRTSQGWRVRLAIGVVSVLLEEGEAETLAVELTRTAALCRAPGSIPQGG